jgi:hypothetical protein
MRAPCPPPSAPRPPPPSLPTTCLPSPRVQHRQVRLPRHRVEAHRLAVPPPAAVASTHSRPCPPHGAASSSAAADGDTLRLHRIRPPPRTGEGGMPPLRALERDGAPSPSRVVERLGRRRVRAWKGWSWREVWSGGVCCGGARKKRIRLMRSEQRQPARVGRPRCKRTWAADTDDLD